MLQVVQGEEKTRRQILIYIIKFDHGHIVATNFQSAGTVYLVSAIVLGAFLLNAAWWVFKVGGNKVAWSMYRWSSMYLAFIFLALMLDEVV